MVKSYLAKEIEGQYAYVITGTHDIGSVLNTDNEGLFSRHIFVDYFKGVPMSRNWALIRLKTSVITYYGLEVMILATQIKWHDLFPMKKSTFRKVSWDILKSSVNHIEVLKLERLLRVILAISTIYLIGFKSDQN